MFVLILLRRKVSTGVKMPFDITLEESFALILVGPSGSGQTTWVKNMLTYGGDQLMRAKPEKVFLLYKIWKKV